jgi:hypothetical protein
LAESLISHWDVAKIFVHLWGWKILKAGFPLLSICDKPKELEFTIQAFQAYESRPATEAVREPGFNFPVMFSWDNL